MNAIRLPALLLAVLLSSGGCVHKPPAVNEKDVVAQIFELERQSKEAAMQRDAGFSQKMLADDYVAIGPLGQLISKADTIVVRQQAQVKFDSIHISQMKIRVYGDTAIVTARAEVRGTDLGEDFSGPYLYTRVWAKLNHEWKIVSYQATVTK